MTEKGVECQWKIFRWRKRRLFEKGRIPLRKERRRIGDGGECSASEETSISQRECGL